MSILFFIEKNTKGFKDLLLLIRKFQADTSITDSLKVQIYQDIHVFSTIVSDFQNCCDISFKKVLDKNLKP